MPGTVDCALLNKTLMPGTVERSRYMQDCKMVDEMLPKNAN